MADYIPTLELQHDDGLVGPLTNCNPASGATLADYWSRGRINTSDVLIRQASGIPVSDGMNFAAVSIGLQVIHPELGEMLYSEHTGPRSPSNPGGGNAQITWNQLLEHMRAGGFACTGGWYRDLPVDLRKWSPNFTGGHMAVAGDLDSNDMFLWGDPLSLGFVRIHINVLWDFIWSTGKEDGNVIVTAAHGFNSPRPVVGRYSDVDPTNIHAADIEKAAVLGLITGIGGGKFGTGQSLTRDQAASLMVRLYDLLNK